jgi:hypothetical protein
VPFNLGPHLRDRDHASGFVLACLGVSAFATRLPCETSSTEVLSCLCEPAPPVRFRAPLATSPVEVRCSWTFQGPAPSALELSQLYDGLLLQPASSSYFIRAPPVGFKVQRAMNGVPCRNRSRCSAKVYLERQSPFGKQKPWTRRGRSHLLRKHR